MHRIAPFLSPRRAVCLVGSLLAFGQVTPSAADSIAEEPPVPAVPSAEAALFASPTTRDHVGRVVVPVTINGQGPFRFIVDTGANHSTISARLVRTLGLQPADATPIVLNGITGSAMVSFVTVDQLKAGELILEKESLPVVSAEVMANADGILGAAGLMTKSLMVDFQHNRVAISRSVASDVRTKSTRIRAVRLTHGLVTLEARVGGVRVLAIVDTGSERTLGNIALRNALHQRERPGVVVQVTSVYGATEEVESGEIRAVPSIQLESLRINDAKVVYGNFHIFKVWKMDDRPAIIIGMDVLGTVPALGIDFEKQDVYLVGIQGGAGNALSLQPGGSLGDSMSKK